MHNDEFGIVTRSGGRRLRWSAAGVAVPLLGVVAAFGTVERGPEPIPTRIVVDPLALSAAPVGDTGRLRSLWFLSDRDTILSVDRLGESFGSFEQQAEVAREIEMKSGEIRTSLFAATDAAGIPDGVAVQLADIF